MSVTRGAQWRGKPVGGVLFDLDGTLFDTAADIANALNLTLAERGWAPLPVGDVARMIGRGSPILVERAAAARGHTLRDTEHAAMVERFFHHYEVLEESGESVALPYAGAAQALRTLHEGGVRIAVVTNKQRRFADALLQRLNLMTWVAVVVGGDTCERRKARPAAAAVRLPIVGCTAVAGSHGRRTRSTTCAPLAPLQCR